MMTEERPRFVEKHGLRGHLVGRDGPQGAVKEDPAEPLNERGS